MHGFIAERVISKLFLFRRELLTFSAGTCKFPCWDGLFRSDFGSSCNNLAGVIINNIHLFSSGDNSGHSDPLHVFKVYQAF